MAGFLDDIDTSSVKYTENYKPISKSTTMRVDTNLKKRLSQMALDQDTSIKAIVDNKNPAIIFTHFQSLVFYLPILYKLY